MLDHADLLKMVKECLSYDSDRLTAWECEFLDSVYKRTQFSDKQADIINRIWDKLFGETSA